MRMTITTASIQATALSGKLHSLTNVYCLYILSTTPKTCMHPVTHTHTHSKGIIGYYQSTSVGRLKCQDKTESWEIEGGDGSKTK